MERHRFSKQYGHGSTHRVTLSDFSKKCAYGSPLRLALAWLQGVPRPPSRAETAAGFCSFIRRPSSRGDHAFLERARRCRTADRCLRYVEAPSHVCLRFSISKPLHGFPPLMRRQDCRSSEFHATGLRSCSVGAGIVDSLARPGGNATGFGGCEYNLAGKWLELP
jgi:hypothetical protein